MPSLIPASPLKKLLAKECNLKSLPENIFHFKVEEVVVHNNEGESRWEMRSAKPDRRDAGVEWRCGDEMVGNDDDDDDEGDDDGDDDDDDGDDDDVDDGES